MENGRSSQLCRSTGQADQSIVMLDRRLILTAQGGSAAKAVASAASPAALTITHRSGTVSARRASFIAVGSQEHRLDQVVVQRRKDARYVVVNRGILPGARRFDLSSFMCYSIFAFRHSPNLRVVRSRELWMPEERANFEYCCMPRQRTWLSSACLASYYSTKDYFSGRRPRSLICEPALSTPPGPLFGCHESIRSAREENRVNFVVCPYR